MDEEGVPITGTGIRVSVHTIFLLCLPSEAYLGELLVIPSPLLGCHSGNLVRCLRVARTYSSGFFWVSSVLCAAWLDSGCSSCDSLVAFGYCFPHIRVKVYVVS